MRQFGTVALACALVIIGASKAAAQEAPKVGVTMSTGTTVGLYVTASDHVAVRGQIGFNRNTSKYDGENFINESTTNTTWTPGASVLFFVRSFDATRIYVSPQYSYVRNTSSLSDSARSTGHQLAGMVGAQHRLGARFAVFAEAGLGWSRTENSVTSALDTSKITSTSFGTRSALGGILFF